MEGYESPELKLIIEEGRRTFDQQSQRFDRIRQTAQITLPIGIALLVVVGGDFESLAPRDIEERSIIGLALWGVAMLLVLAGTLGAGAILVVRASFGAILPTLLSEERPDEVERKLATAYVEQSLVGENTINTRLTLQWWSIALLAWGGLCFAILWTVRSLCVL